MKKHLNILQKCPLFERIDEEPLLRMLTCLGARVETFDKKYTIMAESRPAKYIGILLLTNSETSSLLWSRVAGPR